MSDEPLPLQFRLNIGHSQAYVIVAQINALVMLLCTCTGILIHCDGYSNKTKKVYFTPSI